MTHKNNLKFMPLSLVLMGLAIIVSGSISLFWSMPNHLFTNTWQKTQAEIESVEIFRAGRSGRRGGALTRTLITYTYSWENATHSGKARYSGYVPKTNEKLLNILVNPVNPTQSVRIGYDWYQIFISGILFIGGSLLLWAGLIRRDNSWKQLQGAEAKWNGTVNFAICILAPLFAAFYLYTTYVQAFT